MIINFIQNSALLVSLSVLYGLIKWYKPRNKFFYQLLQGTWFGAVAIAAMMMPYAYSTGVIYDGRSVILTLAGLFGGGYTALVSVLMAGAYRIYLGGSGIWAGLATILFCSLTGLFFRQLFKNKLENIRFIRFVVIGGFAHLVMLASQLLLPENEGLEVISRIGLPVLLILPVTFAVIAKFFQLIGRYIQSEQKIREAESLYRTTLLSIGDAVICTDKRGNITQMNTVSEQLTGWKFLESKGKKLDQIFRIINEETREEVESPYTKVLQSGSIAGLANHTLLISKDGREIPIADSGAPIKNEKGEITGVVLVFRDQTEEREYQIGLQEKNTFIQTVLDNLPIGITLNKIDDGSAFYMNRRFEEIYGWKASELKDIPSFFEKVYPDEDYRNKVIQMIMEGIKSGDPQKMHWENIEITRSDGSKGFVNAVNIPLAEQNTMVSTVMDITSRALAENELKESEERFRKAILLAPIPIMVHDEDGNVINLSEGWNHFSGYTIEEIPTLKAWTEKAYGGKAEEVKNYVTGMFNEGKTILSSEFEITAKSGEKRIWNFYTTPLGKMSSGKRIMLSMAPDITQRKRVQDELVIAKEKAEESERLKTAFLANMSHEIRTPLNGILGFTNLLTTDDNLEKESKIKYASVINKSAEGLLKIINDILDISRLETGKTTIEQKPFDAAITLSAIHSIFEKKRTDAGTNEVELIVQKPGTPLVLNTDENRLMQIFSNLIDNALRFTSEGSVTFGISQVMEGKAEFFVADTGVGIPKEKHAVIFDRFSQADNSTTRSYGGTGLGLSIVKKLLELMGTEITVESEPGKGSVFRFWLPVFSTRGSEEKVSNENPENPGKTRNTKILVVEDDSVSRIYFSQILKNYSGEIFFAETGKEALQLFETQNPDVILMDIGLPDINGLEIVRKIRETNQKVVIIVQTAYAMPDDRQKALEAGCNDYIAKPIKTALLMEKIKQLN